MPQTAGGGTDGGDKAVVRPMERPKTDALTITAEDARLVLTESSRLLSAIPSDAAHHGPIMP